MMRAIETHGRHPNTAPMPLAADRRPRRAALIRRAVVAAAALALPLCAAAPAAAQNAPALFLLPAGDSVEIILGDVSRDVEAFTVQRMGPEEEEFTPLTAAPVSPVADPFRARELIGEDYSWVARRVGSMDPQSVYRKLLVDRSLTVPLSLVSPGVRAAMGLGYSDRAVRRGRTYRYRISLLDFRGETVEVVEEEITAGAPGKPEPPRAVEAEAGDGEVVVEWDYPPYRGRASDTAVAFHVYRSSQGARERVSEAPVLRVEGYLSIIDREVENGRSYRYEVETVSMVGARSRAVESELVTPEDSRAPLVPEDLTASEQDESVRLVWRISPEPDVAGYKIFRAARLKGEFSRINEELVPVGEPRYVDSDVMGGDPYFYRVSAVDEAGNESPRSGVAVLVPADDTPPGALEGLTLTVDEETRAVSLSWQAAAAADLEGYFIYRGESREELVRLQAAPIEPAEEPAFRDAGFQERGLTPGASLVYAVAAVDSSFNVGPKSFVEAEIPDNVPPLPPYSLSARPAENGAVELRWNPRSVSDLAGHLIYRKVDGRRGGEFEMVHRAGRDARMWRDSSVQRGSRYVYRMTHIDEAGNESDPSEEAALVPTDIEPPAPPREIRTREAERRGVIVTWIPSVDGDVVGYHVYRAPYPGGPARQLTDKPIAESPYEDRRGRLSKHYSVSAVDSSANEGEKRSQERDDDQ